MSKKTDRRNAILCLNKIKLSGKQCDIENFYFNHCPKFKPNKRSQRLFGIYTLEETLHVVPEVPHIDGMFDYSKLASQEGRYELMKFDMLGKFKRTRYNNCKYKIVMA